MNRPDPATSGAVLIGTACYDDAALDAVPGARNNVVDLAAALSDPAHLGLAEDRCVQVIDPPSLGEILEPVSEMSARVQDTLLIYFAGHGLVHELDFVLATSRTKVDDPTVQGLPYDYLRSILARSRALRRVVILDCCFSGRATRILSDPASAVIGQIDSEGTYVLTSAPANRPALWLEGERHTVFTGSLLEIAHTGIPGVGEFISLDDLYFQSLRQLAQEGRPRPQRLGSNTAGELQLLRNRSLSGGAARSPSEAFAAAPTLRRRSWSRRTARSLIAAAAVAAPALGRADLDAPDLLARAAATDPDLAEGARPLIEAMQAVREQFGDGAATTAVLVGALIQGIEAAVTAGAEPAVIAAGLEELADGVRRRLLADRNRTAGERASQDAVRTALPDERDLRPAQEATSGPDPHEVVVRATGPWGTGSRADSVISGESVCLAPNDQTRPITLENPVVLVAPDGRPVVPPSLRATITARTRPLLLIAPEMTVMASRALRHGQFAPIVAIRAAAVGEQVRAVAGEAGAAARRVLVNPDATTIIGLVPTGTAPETGTSGPAGRVVEEGAGRPGEVERAVRAQAVLRAAGVAGVAPGGGTVLFWASRVPAALPGTDGPGRSAAGILADALTAPLRGLVANRGLDEESLVAQLLAVHDPSVGIDLRTGRTADLAATGVVDPVETVAGVLAHATATISRFL